MNRKIGMRIAFFVVIVMFAGAASPGALAQEGKKPDAMASKKAGEKRPLKIEDFWEMKNVGNAELSPDDKWVAYTVSTRNARDEGRGETVIYILPTAGGEPWPMTMKTFASSNPRWSPDGKHLTFTSSRGDAPAGGAAAAPAGGGGPGGGAGPRSQVWMLDLRGGEAQQLTEVRQGVNNYSWSPDGTRLLLSVRDPDPLDVPPAEGERPAPRPRTPKPWVIDRLQFKQDRVGYLADNRHTHLFVFDIASKKVTQITSGNYDENFGVWSPDGKNIAFTSNRTPDPDNNFNSDIWIVSADNSDMGKTLLQVTTNPGPDRSPQWSPDGKSIAYVTATDTRNFWYSTNYLATVTVPVGTPGGKVGTPQILTQKMDRNVGSPEYSPDGKYIYFTLEDSGEEHLARIPAGGGEITRPVAGARSVNDFALGKQGAIVVRFSDHNSTGELYALENGNLRQLTKVNEKFFAQIRLGDVEKIKFKSKDGTDVEGYLYKPLGYEAGIRYPTLLRLHGGPVSQYSAGFNFESQLFAANGYVVLNINPRGSSGYGQAFCQAIFADWGNRDFQDVMAGVDYAISKGYSDPDKLGVGGWSYGGMLTNYTITQTGRFKGAISGASLGLAPANYGHDHYQRHYEIELGLPWEHRDVWDKVSPFWKVDKITTPTLWIVGEVDWNVPAINSEQMYQAMRRIGKAPTQLVVYPGEYHGITRPSYIKDRFERYLAWYGKYVKGEDQKPQQKADE